MSEKPCCSVQLIDGQGVFKETELKIFMKDVELSGCGLSYAFVSIMGPQSSGKRTLLNHLFHTNFKEMDAFKGRSQTNQGIWLSNAVGSKLFTVVMDLEGTDGREREDDTTFEKQSALFALAVSDIVLINMWCHDIGREQAANKPLLKTVFQVMMRLFSPRKTTLLFVIRDKMKTTLEVLEPILREDIQKIWESVPKVPNHKVIPLSEFFNVEITALSSYEEKEEFKEQVSLLRRRCFQSIDPGGLAGDRRAVVPASGFPFSIKQIWQNIKENKDLDLSAHKVMVATVRCEEIAKEKVDHLTNDEDWRELEKEVQSGPIPGFGEKLSTILDTYFLSYDMEVVYFEESVRTKNRQQMVNESLNLVYPAHQAMVKHLHSKALNRFKEEVEEAVKKGQFGLAVKHSTKSCIAEFDEGCSDAKIVQASWDPSKSREKLEQEIAAYWESRTAIPYAKILSKATTQLINALIKVVSFPGLASPDTWPSLREVLKNEPERAVSNAVSNFSKENAGYRIDDEARNEMVAHLKIRGRMVLDGMAKKGASEVSIDMQNRFKNVFNHDKKSWPRLSNGRVDFQAIAKDARSASLKLLAAMAALRLDEKPDNIEATLFSAFIDGIGTTGSLLEGSSSSSVNPLVSNTWEGFSPSDVLIEPIECKRLWKKFVLEAQVIVDQALAVQEENERREQLIEDRRREFEERIMEFEERRRRDSEERMLREVEENIRRQSLIPPPWAIVALVVLGLNEFMALLRNPTYIVVIFVFYLLGKALAPFVQLDIPGDLLRFLNVMSDRLLAALFPRHYGH